MIRNPLDPKSEIVTDLPRILEQYWGYHSFRPLQREAMEAVLSGRDSLLVLPTGGGKSLCFQAPAVASDGLAVVVSPLISLMKDQVDTLVGNGVPAACYNSSLPSEQKSEVARGVRDGRYRLLYVAPERLVGDGGDGFLNMLSARPISFIAVDEAHCISQWGHDFRPEYRQLARLRDRWPAIGLHAYTATATARVRRDIVAQLGLARSGRAGRIVRSAEPRLPRAARDRRSRRRSSRCSSAIAARPASSTARRARKWTPSRSGCRTPAGARGRITPGMADDERHRNQDAFLNEEIDLVVATVAFGMGIDRSDVRFVIHAGAPQSLEHYQQESGPRRP